MQQRATVQGPSPGSSTAQQRQRTGGRGGTGLSIDQRPLSKVGLVTEARQLGAILGQNDWTAEKGSRGRQQWSQCSEVAILL